MNTPTEEYIKDHQEEVRKFYELSQEDWYMAIILYMQHRGTKPGDPLSVQG